MMASVPNHLGRSHENDAAHSKDGLGGLVAGGASRVGIDGAMRARDVARPSAADLAEAEAELVVKHAAQRTESKPLPLGILPAPAAASSAQPPKHQHPTPHPPRAAAGDQPPDGTAGSTPVRS